MQKGSICFFIQTHLEPFHFQPLQFSFFENIFLCVLYLAIESMHNVCLMVQFN